MGTAPAEGTLGIGVGYIIPPEMLRNDAATNFHSIVWFPYGAEDEAKQFAEENGYKTQTGVPL